MKPTEQLELLASAFAKKCDPLNQTLEKQADLRQGYIAGFKEVISQMQPEWVACSERLPDIGIEVLVFRPSSQKWGDKQITIDYMVKSQRYDPDQILHSWSRIWNVTHWMPLPQPPTK